MRLTCTFALKILLVLLLGAIPAAATTVTGTAITDPSGAPYANGTVTAFVPGDTVITVGPALTTGAGSFSFTVPAGTWSFKVCAPQTLSPKFATCFTLAGVVIAGGSQDISAVLIAAAININPSTGATGTINPTSVIDLNNPGVFNTTTTISTMSSPNVFAIGAGVNANCPTLVYNNFAALGSVGLTDTDALDGCIIVPAGNGVTNAASVGVQGWAYNNNNGLSGQFGFSAAAALGGFAWCNAGGVNLPRCLGLSAGAGSTTGNGGAFLQGAEFDITAPNAADRGIGMLISLRGTGPSPSMIAYEAQTLNANKFTVGFSCDAGAMSVSALNQWDCFDVGDSNDGSHDSQLIWFHGGTATSKTALSVLADDEFNIAGRMVAVGRLTGTGLGTEAAFGILGKSTASIAAGLLMKIDTANADSWVICTTADTQCDGVSTSATYCAAGGTGCPIITVPGSKAELLVGTGTCTIGQFVIVDTTTNGRVKCQAGIPAQGAFIGKALSAQATVGNAVDVLMKFQ